MVVAGRVARGDADPVAVEDEVDVDRIPLVGARNTSVNPRPV